MKLNRRQRRAQRRQTREIPPPPAYIWQNPETRQPELRMVGEWAPIPEPWWLGVITKYTPSGIVSKEGNVPRHDYELVGDRVTGISCTWHDTNGSFRLTLCTPEFMIHWYWSAERVLKGWEIEHPGDAQAKAAVLLRPEVEAALKYGEQHARLHTYITRAKGEAEA